MARKLGKYEIIERIGRGGMAEVYRAYNANLDRYEAIKVLHSFLADAPEFKTRFEKEARNIARLKHPHIVQVYDFNFDPDTGSYYMVMELIEGGTLKDRLQELAKNGEVMPLGEALRYIRESADALSYAHKQGMIHRDVKPANLMVDRDGRIVLTDFGIAKIVTGPQFTVTGGMVGTPAYMSPEQGMGEPGDERSDLYSLGVILYELLTGKPPYSADTPLALILKHVNSPIPSACENNPRLPPFVDEVINKLLAKDPAERYQNADELIADLQELEHRSLHQTQPLNDTPVPPSLPPDNLSVVVDDDDSPTIRKSNLIRQQAKQQTKKSTRSRTPLLVLIFLALLVGAAGIYVIGAQSGVFPAFGGVATDTQTPTSTQTPTLTATDTPLPPTATPTTAVPVVVTEPPTSTPSPTITPEPQATSTNTPTPEVSPTPSVTPNITQTVAFERTATTAACVFDYAVVEQSPEDGDAGGFFTVNSPYTREITLLNTGTCTWEVNTSLTFVEGESFNAGPRIFIREPVEPAEEVTITFEGTLPPRGSLEPISGTWEMRTPGQIRFGDPLVISILVFDPGS